MTIAVAATAALALVVITAVATGQDAGNPADAKEEAVLRAFSKRTLAGTGEREPLARQRGPRGRRGPKGKRGPAGPAGAKGTFGSIITSEGPAVALCGWESGACSVGSSTVMCPPNTSVVSGGYAGAGIRAFIDAPIPGGWFIGAVNESVFATDFNAFVVCASQ